MKRRTRMNLSRPVWAVLFALVSACGDADPAAAPPIIRQFSVDGASLVRVPAGRPVVLAWEVAEAFQIRLDAEPGGQLLASAPLVGTFRTEPILVETRFVLTAVGVGGEASKVVQVLVEPSDAVEISSFRAVPETVLPGESSSLSWEVLRAEQIRIDAIGGEVVLAGDTRPSGTVNVRPAVSTTYLLTASGPSGPALAAVTVLVQGSPRVLAFRAESSRIQRGETTLLVYRVENAERVMIFDGSGAILASSSEQTGQVEVGPLETARYTLSLAKDGFPEVRAELTVIVDQPPGARWVSASASPDAVDYGDPVDVLFEADNAPQGMRAEFRGQELFRSALATGAFTFTPTVSGTLELFALNEGEGGDERSIPVEVRPVAPRILAFAAHPMLAILGGTYAVSFEVRGADQLELREASTVHPLDPSGAGPVSLVATSTLTELVLEASNAFGAQMAAVLVAATNQPVVDVFSVTPEVFDGRTVTATLSYAVRNATALELSGPGGSWARFPSPALAVGGWSVVLEDTGFVRLRAQNDNGAVVISKAVARLSPEEEPNDDPSSAQALLGEGGGVRATLETSADLDYYRLDVANGAGLVARLGRRSLGCPDPALVELSLLGADGALVLATAGYEDPEACLAIGPDTHPGAGALEEGPVYLRVSGAQPLEYVLTASVSNGP